MKLDSFLALPKQVASKRTAVKPVGSADIANAIVPVSTEPPATVEPSQVTTDVTPSGIIVEYESKPKRLYRVNGIEVPSVTTVLDVLNKGGLTVWGMRVGIQGVLSLFERGYLTTELDWQTERERVAVSAGHLASVELVEGLMKIEGLTTNDVKDSAADRGTNVHDALEEWAKTGRKPIAGEFPESEMGYVQGLVEFLQDADPEPVRTEVMVGSVEHGFAGRYDLELRFNEPKKVRRTPKRAWHDIPAGTYLVDFKSSKGVYPSTHFRQLAAYEAARVECGYEPTDAQYVLNANGEGSYAFVKSTAKLADFLAVLSVYNSDRQMGARKAA